MGDTAVCVNPSDERYLTLKGKYAIVPLVNRKVPIIFDDYVDPAFGTGALKVTPAHDINDYNLGLKHSLPVIDTLNEDGTLSAARLVAGGSNESIFQPSWSPDSVAHFTSDRTGWWNLYRYDGAKVDALVVRQAHLVTCWDQSKRHECLVAGARARRIGQEAG